MPHFTLSIDLDNDAFAPDSGPEVARILSDLANSVQGGEGLDHTLVDINGHTVGHARLGEPSAEAPGEQERLI